MSLTSNKSTNFNFKTFVLNNFEPQRRFFFIFINSIDNSLKSVIKYRVISNSKYERKYKNIRLQYYIMMF